MGDKRNMVSVQQKKMKKESAFHAVFVRLRQNKTAMFGIGLFFVMLILSILSPWITPYSYAEMDLSSAFQGPSMQHWFGTDNLGRDILTRILYGGRFSLTIGLISVLMAALVGVAFGSVAGFFGGRIDNLFMRFLDIFQAIPGMLLTIAISAALGSGFGNTIFALALSRIPEFARVIRGSVMKVRDMEYMEAAEAIGCSTFTRIVRYTLPNSIAPVIVSATMGIANTVLTLASLSYIGLGIRPPAPEWGAMLSQARGYVRSYPYMLIFPGICIAITVLALNMFGDGLRDALDPKLKD